MKHKTTTLSIRSLNPTLGFGWFTGISSIKKTKALNHQFKTEKNNH